MLRAQIQPLPLKALGALAFRQQRGLWSQFSAAAAMA